MDEIIHINWTEGWRALDWIEEIQIPGFKLFGHTQMEIEISLVDTN